MLQTPFNGYTTLDAMGKPVFPAIVSTPPICASSVPSNNMVSPAPGTSNNSLISGYVTHKQLSAFGQQGMQ